MDFQGDLRIIHRVAIEKDEQNWKFRSFLKQFDHEINKNLLDCRRAFSREWHGQADTENRGWKPLPRAITLKAATLTPVPDFSRFLAHLRCLKNQF